MTGRPLNLLVVTMIACRGKMGRGLRLTPDLCFLRNARFGMYLYEYSYRYGELVDTMARSGQMVLGRMAALDTVVRQTHPRHASTRTVRVQVDGVAIADRQGIELL
jgi:hypothetical protein